MVDLVGSLEAIATAIGRRLIKRFAVEELVAA
jgi:hypothetical protein